VSCPKIGLHNFSKKVSKMKGSKVVLGLRHPSEFSIEDRRMIIEEYLSSGKSKQEIWERYTGRKEEKGDLIKWMRQLGYDIAYRRGRLPKQTVIPMSKKEENFSSDNFQLKERIKQLELALINSELRATAMETMIEVAEKELKISIKKKSYTKPSTK
jgi:hypothetical protein